MDFFCSIPGNTLDSKLNGRGVDDYTCVDKAPRLGKFFELDKLFGELRTKHQKETARKHLDIKEEYSWDDLTGDITELPELRAYLDDLMAYKADITSPAFMGSPTAVNPKLDDLSNRLATTQWVAEYIASLDLSTGGGSSSGGSSGGGSSSPSTPTPTGTVYYYGVSVDNLTKSTASSFTVTANKGEYVYVYYPSDSVSFAVNGFVGGFENISYTVDDGVKYYIYKSANSGLGTIKVTIS